MDHSMMMSMTTGSAASASATMDMGSMAMSMSLSMSMPMSSSSLDSGDMHMDSMSGMHMFFTTQYKNYPVLFESLKATTKAQAFGIFVLLFVVAFAARGLEFLRNYLEQAVWHNPVYNDCHNVNDLQTPSSKLAPVSSCCAKGEDSDITADMEVAAPQPNNKLPLASRFFRDIIRLVLCILPDLFGYALMLVAMTYTLTYFFAVVIGSGCGRFFFERISDRMNLKPTTGLSRHC